ncbi:MAG: ribonuclease III [Cellulosilyticaceae bacterium]
MAQKSFEQYNDLQRLNELEEIINYEFKNLDILREAVTHRSFANEHRSHSIRDNERLEFLGDAILDLNISQYLFDKYPNMSEGDLSKIRASIVCEASLAKVAKSVGLGKYIMLGKGEEMTGGRERISILADLFEAVTGALLVDEGVSVVTEFLNTTLIASVDHLTVEDLYTDYKTLLQENIQKGSIEPLNYVVMDEKGPDHDKDFYVSVFHQEQCLGRGNGKSKKEAEQQAAKDALKKIENK